MGAEHPIRLDDFRDGRAGAGAPSRSPLVVKKAKPRLESEASLCAIKVTREAAREANQRHDPRQPSENPVAMEFRGEELGATILNISTRGAMVRCEVEPFIGETLELTFPGDERIEGVVRWVRDGCVGVEFGVPTCPTLSPPPTRTEAPPLPRLERIEAEADPAPEDAEAVSAEGNRIAKRARVLLAARLQTQRGEFDARLRDLSCRGALLECNRSFAVGEAVTFSRGQTAVVARVAWTSGNRIGLEFAVPIEESEVLIHVNPAGAPAQPQNHIQAMEQARGNEPFRRPNFSERLTDYDRKLARVIGASLGVGLIDE
jgi:hypothetical protein